MEKTTTKKGSSDEVEAPKKIGKAYAVKRLKETVTAVQELDLLTEDEKETLNKIANNMAMRYLGIAV